MTAIITTPGKVKNKITTGEILMNGFSKIVIVTVDGKIKGFDKQKHIVQIIKEVETA